MVPSFFKKLGPISSDLVKSAINCKIVNVSKDALSIFEDSEEKRILQSLTKFSLNRKY